jgi:hypothetical protein
VINCACGKSRKIPPFLPPEEGSTGLLVKILVFFLSSFPNLVVQICFSEFVQFIRGLRHGELE